MWERTLAPLQGEAAVEFFSRIICDGVEYGEDHEENPEFGPSGSESDHETSGGGESGSEEGNEDGKLTKSLLPKASSAEDQSANADEEDDGDDDYEPEETEETEGDGNGNGGDEEDGEGDVDGDEDEDEEEESRPVVQPNPEPFAADKFYLHQPLNFRELYGRKGRPLQVIVKLANIEWTPEKPKYEGGSWHVEGKQVGHSLKF